MRWPEPGSFEAEARCTARALPLPACGERVGVRGRIHDSERLSLVEMPPHPAASKIVGRLRSAALMPALPLTAARSVADLAQAIQQLRQANLKARRQADHHTQYRASFVY